MTKLKISPTLSLPLDFVTSTQAILAKKGKGKTYKASVQAEELLDAHQQIVAIDPTGAWYGLRSSADGKSAGYPVTIFGGEHADVPLEATAGEVIAEAIAAEHFSAVVDLTLFRKGEALRFMATFLETLYRKNRAPLHLFIDEADVVAPQKPFGPDEARVLGACEDIVRRGRIRGIGCTLITQRPQVLNKNVLSQVDMLTALGMNHPKDIGAIRDWVAVHGDESQAKQMIADLPALPVGEAWIWAPAADIFKRVTFRDRRTFDSGKTPKAGERRVMPKVLAQVDLARLGETIAASVQRAKDNDPKALKARVAELEKQLAAKPAAKVETKVVERPVPSTKALGRLEAAITAANKIDQRLTDALGRLDIAINEATAELRTATRAPTIPPAPAIVRHRTGTAIVLPLTKQPENVTQNIPADGLTPAQQRILDTLGTFIGLRIAPTKTVLAAWLGTHPNTKSLANNLGALRSAGLLDDLALTAEGHKLARPRAPLTDHELHKMLIEPLTPAQRRIVDVVSSHGSVSRDKLAEDLNLHPNTKSLANDVGALRSRGLVTGGWPIELERVFYGGAS